MGFNETPGIPVGTPQEAPPTAQGTNLPAILGLVAGVVGLVCSPFPVLSFAGLALAVLGLVLSIVGKKKVSQGAGGNGAAIGGIVVSVLALVSALMFSACYVACGMAAEQAKRDMERNGVNWEQVNAELEKAKGDFEAMPGEPADPAPSEPSEPTPGEASPSPSEPTPSEPENPGQP